MRILTITFILVLTRNCVNSQSYNSVLWKIEDRLSFFDDLPIHEQLAPVIDLVNNYDEQKKLREQINSYYSEEKINELHSAFLKQPHFKKYADRILVNRHRKWIPEIEKSISNKPTLIAVGAVHLAGQTGLIELLTKAGYKVSPIDN